MILAFLKAVLKRKNKSFLSRFKAAGLGSTAGATVQIPRAVFVLWVMLPSFFVREGNICLGLLFRTAFSF